VFFEGVAVGDSGRSNHASNIARRAGVAPRGQPSAPRVVTDGVNREGYSK
jgi:hypothetical protein